MEQKPQMYCVRTGSHDEHVIHVPKTTTGWYWMTVEDNGDTIRFVKAK